MIGFSCPPLCMMPFRDAAKLVIPHFRHWEVVSEACHFLPDIEKDIGEYLETSDMSMSVHAPFSAINLAAFDERTRRYAVETLCEVIRISARLGIGPVTVHPGVVGPIQRFDRERVFGLTRKSLEDIVAEAGDLGVGIALENMPAMAGTICHTAAEMEIMIDGLDIGICVDIGHANTAGQIEPLLGMGERIANMHVHDNAGERDQHLALGGGNIDFSVLGRLSYSGNHIIEANSTDMAEAAAGKQLLESILR